MIPRKKKWLWLSGILLLVALAAGIVVWLLSGLPDSQTINSNLHPPSVRILDRKNRLLYEILPEDSGRHSRVPLAQIPEALRQATIATEDSTFYENPGVDIGGIIRAVWINLRGRETLAGGSTITQQVARNLLLTTGERNERSLRRKLRESILAWQIARQYSKDEILELYLNQIYYGGLSYGAQAASQTYFGKPVSELDLAQCALLAGIPQAPAVYNPFTNSKAAYARQQVVLSLMVKRGYISSEQEKEAKGEILTFSPQPYPAEALHFVTYTRALLDQWVSQTDIYQYGGLVIHTTLDLDWQHLAENAIHQQLDRLRKASDGINHNVNSAALVALDPQTGAIRSMVGSPDFFNAATAGSINMTIAPRQPGSALKPIVYARAMDPSQSAPWTAATSILDVRTNFVTHDGFSYTPANYDGKEHGPVSVRTALASSLNIPAVITLNHIGMDGLFNMASRMGISTLGSVKDADLSLALGGGEVTLLELTGAYAVFSNGGYRVTPFAVEEIDTPSGYMIRKFDSPTREKVLDERVAWLITDILSDDQARAIGFGLNSALKLDRPAAVKTGTTTNFHDNWTIGYTPDLVTGVWAGNADYQAMYNVTGLTGAAPVWHEFMRSVLSGQPEKSFRRPEGLVEREVCSLSGLLPTPDCPYRRLEWFIAGTAPEETDHFYHTVFLDSETGRLADENTPPEKRIQRQALDLPPQAQPWARENSILLLSDLQSQRTVNQTETQQLLVLLNPVANSRFRISDQLPIEAQQLFIQAAGPADLKQVSIWLDGALLVRLNQRPYETWWRLVPGHHEVWVEAVLASGETASSVRIPFDVLSK
jgi:1A family penicillin-binding protein